MWVNLPKQVFSVTYDASEQGESCGEPCFLESPSARVADISYIIDYFNN